MQAVFERGGKSIGDSSGQRRDQQRTALNVEDHVGARIGFGKNAAGLHRWQQEIRHDHGDAEAWMQFEARGMGDITGIGGARDDRTVDASGDVVRMPFDSSGFIQHAPARPAQTEHSIGDHDAGGESGGARTESFTQRDGVIDVQLDRRHGALHVAGNARRCVPDQIVFAAGDRLRVAAVYMNRELVRGAEAAFQINAQSQCQRIEGGSKIGTGCGNP